MHESFDELLPIYVLGALDGEELAALERHLAAGCETCARELVRYEQTAADLALSVAPVTPPPSLRDRVLSAAASGNAGLRDSPIVAFPAPPSAGTGARRAAAPGALAAAAAVVLASGITILYLGWSLASTGRSLGEQTREVESLRIQLAQQDRKLSEAERRISIIQDPQVRVTSLAATPGPPRPAADVLWHPDQKRGLLLARGLTRVTPDKTYELWLIADNKPVKAALFNVDENGNAVVDVGELPGAATPELFAVTIEPAGGRDAPSGDILIAGQYPKG